MIIKNIGNIIPHNWKGDIDLLNIVLLGLAEDLPEKAEEYELHRLLGALLSSKLKVDEKLDIIGNEFQIPLESDIRKDVSEMCNLSQGIEDRAYERGTANGLAKAVLRMYKKGYSIEQISDTLDMDIKEVQDIIEFDSYQLLKLFTEYFKKNYEVECVSALHHNKRKTNYHIHLIFSERQLLKEPIIKIASRNMFYNEKGKHVRTKKEILGESGEIRTGCHIVEKGEVYEKKIFTKKDERFKSERFLDEVKHSFTDLMNVYVGNDEEKLNVFQHGSVYLPTKKIGKNNPKEAEIRADNAIRQEWNWAVDVALVEGVPEEKILKIKKEEISTKIAQSISRQGFQPRVFREILLAALQILREYIRKLKIPSKPKLEIDMKEFYEMENLKSKLDQKLRGIRQAEQVELPRLEKDLKDITGFFKGKEKKEAQNKIDQCKERIRKQKDELHILVKKSGYPNVQKFMDGYRTAYKIVEQYKKELEVWKQKTGQNDIQPDKKKSVRERLKENEKRVKERERPKSLNKQKKHDWLDR